MRKEKDLKGAWQSYDGATASEIILVLERGISEVVHTGCQNIRLQAIMSSVIFRF